MKAAIPLLLAALLSLPSPPDEVAYSPAAGLRVRRTFEAEGSVSLASATLSIDGEEQGSGGGGSVMDTLERIVVVDRVVAASDGRPERFERTFEDLVQEATATYETEDGEEELEETSSSPLEGKTVVFSWDADAEAYDVEPAEDEEIEAELLAGLHEDMDLRALLPDDEVDVDDSWEVDGRAYLPLMWPGGFLGFQPDGAEEVDDGLDRRLADGLRAEGTATYRGTRDEDGVRAAVIELELEASSEVDVEESDGPYITSMPPMRITSRHRVEGTLLWNLAAGMPHSGSFEAGVVRVSRTRMTTEGPAGEVDMAWELEYGGSIEYTMAVEILE